MTCPQSWPQGPLRDVFAPAERTMVGRVLGLAERPVRTIMTPARGVIWLEVDDDAQVLSRRILRAGHAAYPVCRGGLGNLLGVARAPDLICDLLQRGALARNAGEKPLTFLKTDRCWKWWSNCECGGAHGDRQRRSRSDQGRRDLHRSPGDHSGKGQEKNRNGATRSMRTSTARGSWKLKLQD